LKQIIEQAKGNLREEVEKRRRWEEARRKGMRDEDWWNLNWR